MYTETQPFDVYNKISRNYTHSFLFESLEGPDELAETSIMGFDPELIVTGYFDKITIQNRDGKIETIQTMIWETNFKMSFLLEFWRFLMMRKKYWLLPIIIVLVLFGGLIILSQGSAVAPFIYTIF